MSLAAPRGASFLVLCLLLPACAGSLGEARAPAPGRFAARPPPSVRCQTLDDRHSLWASVAQGSGIFAGASGIGTLPVPESDKAERIGLGVGALITGGLAAFAVCMSSASSESWVRECAP